MQCPFCNNQETQVRDSRPTEENSAIDEDVNVLLVAADLPPLKEYR